jgi:hypothetical protein
MSPAKPNQMARRARPMARRPRASGPGPREAALDVRPELLRDDVLRADVLRVAAALGRVDGDLVDAEVPLVRRGGALDRLAIVRAYPRDPMNHGCHTRPAPDVLPHPLTREC